MKLPTLSKDLLRLVASFVPVDGGDNGRDDDELDLGRLYFMFYARASYEQHQAADEVLYTDNNILITGNAGVGKSFVVDFIRRAAYKSMVVCAPTGPAAINVNGSTIDSLFTRKRNLAKKTVIVDEIGMVRATHIDRLIELGAKRFVFTGDFAQLPPVLTSDDEIVPGTKGHRRIKKTQHTYHIGRQQPNGGLFSFEHDVFEDCVRHHLVEQFRQRSSTVTTNPSMDLNGSLDDLRSGTKSPRLMRTIRHGHIAYQRLTSDDKDSILHTYSTNARVRGYNDEQMAKLIATGAEHMDYPVTQHVSVCLDLHGKQYPVEDDLLHKLLKPIAKLVDRCGGNVFAGLTKREKREMSPVDFGKLMGIATSAVTANARAGKFSPFHVKAATAVVTRAYGTCVFVGMPLDVIDNLMRPSDVERIRNQVLRKHDAEGGFVRVYMGQRVLVKRNFHSLGLVNGSRGVVSHFGEVSLETKTGDVDDIASEPVGVGMVCDGDAETNVIHVPMTTCNDRMIVGTRSTHGDEQLHLSVSTTLVPVAKGYSSTIHGLQGTTQQRLCISLARMFTCGLTYVAISRLVSANGLYVIDMPSGGAWFRPHAAYTTWESNYTTTKSVHLAYSTKCAICGVWSTHASASARCLHYIAVKRGQPRAYRDKRSKPTKKSSSTPTKRAATGAVMSPEERRESKRRRAEAIMATLNCK
jgi:hypothetical protein